MEALIAARERLVTRLFTQAPPSYRVRIFVLLGLYILLFLQSTVFVVLWFQDRHRRGKSMKIIQMQKTAQGPMISVQALCAYAFLQVIISIVACVRQGIMYKGYFKGGDRTLEEIFYVPLLSGACFSGLAFTFSHLSAVILIFGGNSRSKAVKRFWIPLYNFAFVSFPLVWVGVFTSQVVKIHAAENEIIKAGRQVLPLLESVISKPTSLTATILRNIRSLQAILERNVPIAIEQRKGICIIGMAYCSFLAIMCCIGLWVIHILRRNIKEVSRALYDSNRFSFSRTGGQDGQQRVSQHNFPLPGRGAQVTPYHNRGSSFPTRKVAPKGKDLMASDDEGATMRKLVRDLQTSVPLILLLSTYFPIALGTLYVKGVNAGWMWEEFRNDIFSWPWTTINNIIFAIFHFNSLRRRGRNGSSTGSTTIVEEHQLTNSQELGNARLVGDPLTGRQLLNVHLDGSPLTALEDRETARAKEVDSEKRDSFWD